MNPPIFFSLPIGYAPVACATLRYFYPGCSCTAASTGSVTKANAARPAGQRPAAQSTAPLRLQAYPNPTRDRLNLQVSGPCPAGTRVELLEMSTGRVVLSRPLANPTAELAIMGLAPGVYAGRAVSETGQVLGTCKVVIIR